MTVNLFTIFHTVLTAIFGFMFGGLVCGYRIYDGALFFLIIIIIFIVDLIIGLLLFQKRHVPPWQITLKLLIGSFIAFLLTITILACFN